MSYHSDVHNTPADRPNKVAGPGMSLRMRCLGCDQSRSTEGSKGRGILRRCAECVRKREQRRAGAA